MWDAFVPVSVEGVVGRIRSEPGRPRRIDTHRILPPRGGGARRTWGVSPMVNARPPHPRVERAAGLQSLRSKFEEKRGKIQRSQVHCARHAFTSQLTLAVRRRNLEYGDSSGPNAGPAGLSMRARNRR